MARIQQEMKEIMKAEKQSQQMLEDAFRGLDMKLIKCKIGELIEQINDVNSDLKYDENSAVGMTITKEIIPTKANLNGTDLSKFIIVRPESFIYNPRTHGKRLALDITILKILILSAGIILPLK